jgi:hypothetical protein
LEGANAVRVCSDGVIQVELAFLSAREVSASVVTETIRSGSTVKRTKPLDAIVAGERYLVETNAAAGAGGTV